MSSQFSRNQLNGLRNLFRELTLIEDLFRELPTFNRASVRLAGAVDRPVG